MSTRRTSRNLFGGLFKKKETYRRSAGQASPAMQAYRAGVAAGDTGAFDSWLKRKRFDQFDRSTIRRMEEQFRRGVERAGQAERVAAKRKERKEAAREAKAERRGRKAVSYRGVQIIPDGDLFRLSKLDKESRFDTVADARAFIRSEKQNPGCAMTRKSNITDRAKRYRANQPGCRPKGVKKCKLCPSREDLMVDHIDGDESNGRKSNLRWLCRSCNTALGAEMARAGVGRRTLQYNPTAQGGAANAYEYMLAALQHTRGAHDAGGKIIHNTPKKKRREYAAKFWEARKAHQAAGGAVDYPDWVSNPAVSRAQYRLAQAVLSGTALEAGHMTPAVAREIVERTPARLRSKFMKPNPAETLYERIKPGSRVTIVNRFGQRKAGRAVMRGPAGWVLNMGGRYGTPDIASPANVVKVSGGGTRRELIEAGNYGDNPDAGGRVQSRGHLFDKDGFEWFRAGDEIYRAPLDAVIDTQTGYRIGRWEFPAHQLASRRKHGVYPFPIANPENDFIEKPISYRGATVEHLGHNRYRVSIPARIARDGRAASVEVHALPNAKARIDQEFGPRRNPTTQMSGTSSMEYRLGYHLGQTDRSTAALERTPAELDAAYSSQFAPDPVTFGEFVDGYTAGYHLGETAANPRRRRNPDSVPTRSPRGPHQLEDVDDAQEYAQAKKTAELFHGRPVKEELEVVDQIKTHNWYVCIGPLVSLKVKLPLNPPKPYKRTVTFPFGRDERSKVMLWCSPDGRQFYLRGGDQELDLEVLGMGPDTEWWRDHMNVGEITYVTYEDRKKFHEFKLTDYYHKIGTALDRSGFNHVTVTKVKPMLVFDTLSKKLSFVGGWAKVETETLVEEMSPGIVG
jgi:hypothetical protein